MGKIRNKTIKTMIRFTILAALLGLSALLPAQNPVPALPQSRPIAIVGATVHPGNGQAAIADAVVTFANGKITAVTTRQANPNLSGHEVVEAAGKHVYPGFIAPNTQLGLVEIEAVRATRDNAETGDMNPNVRSLIAYNTDSRVIPTVRARGVLLGQITPEGGALAGSSSIVQLDAWNWEDAALFPDDGQHLYWPNRFSYSWQTQSISKNERYDQQVADLRQFLTEARGYCDQPAPKTANLKFEALCPIFKGERNLYVHASLARDIEEAVLLAREFGARLVIVGGRDSYQVAGLLVENNVPVLLGQLHSLPAMNDTDIDQPYKTAAQLHRAGVRFGLTIGGFWQQRNLPFQAGTAVAYGLPYEEAVRALTSATADILGIGNRVGALAPGKDATLFISAGDALDMRSSVIERAYIEGRQLLLDDVQKTLYERFQEKYRRQKR
jgi:imidazolonepropionase-like amidohydrolase